MDINKTDECISGPFIHVLPPGRTQESLLTTGYMLQANVFFFALREDDDKPFHHNHRVTEQVSGRRRRLGALSDALVDHNIYACSRGPYIKMQPDTQVPPPMPTGGKAWGSLEVPGPGSLETCLPSERSCTQDSRPGFSPAQPFKASL